MDKRSKYKPDTDFLKLAKEYLETCGRNQTKLPKTSEYCREFVGVNEDTVYKWIEKYNNKSLIGAIKRVKEAQMEQLMDDGLYGGKEVNNAMAIFLLKANHGLIETERREIAGEGILINLDINDKTNRLHATQPVSTETD